MALAAVGSRRADRPHPADSPGRAALMELRGRVALVTGAGRRLGRAMAHALAGRGMTLAIHHHGSAAGAEELRQESPGRWAGGPPASPRTSATPPPRPSCPAGWPPSSAGSTCWSTPPPSCAASPSRTPRPGEYDAVLDLNLRSVFFCTQGAAPALRAAHGKVINLADLSGLEPWPGFAAHSVSKAGRGHAHPRAGARAGARRDRQRHRPGHRARARRVRRRGARPAGPDHAAPAGSARPRTRSPPSSTCSRAATS